MFDVLVWVTSVLLGGRGLTYSDSKNLLIIEEKHRQKETRALVIDFSPILKTFLPFQGAEIVWVQATYSMALFLSCLEGSSSSGDCGILFKLNKKITLTSLSFI